MSAALRFDGLTALVTGAGGALGRAHALSFAGRGADVVVCDIDAGAAATTVKMIREGGGRAVPSTRDLATSAGAAATVADAIGEFGRLDILVNNAGLLLDADFSLITDEDWRRTMAVNVDGSFYLTRAAWPWLSASPAARIVFVTSASGLFGNVGHAHYSTAKAAVIGMMKAVALEGAPLGIVANAVAPLAVSAQSLASVPTTSRRQSARQIIGEVFDTFAPEYVSGVILALAHASWPTSGRVISASGSLTRVVGTQVSEGVVRDTWDGDSIAEQWDALIAGAPTSPDSLAEDMAEIRSRLSGPRA